MKKFEELLVGKGLYDNVSITVDDLDEMELLLSGSIYNGYNIECFCIECNETRIFESVDKEIHEERGFMVTAINKDGPKTKKTKKETVLQQYLDKRYCISFRCTREHNHSLLFDLLITDNKMIKIGQYPSFADILAGNTTKYKSTLSNKYREYCEALGLFSHGIGIGAFVYLRRIIETLVFEKYEEVVEILGVDREVFLHSEFKDKIEILKDHLPNVLVENKNVYGIVSKGIHELNEQECISMFPYIQAGIELILDDILIEKERKEKEKLFSKFVEDKTGELRSRTDSQ